MKTVKLSTIKSNPNNPRVVRDEKFQKLKRSIEEFPKMMDIRPMVVNNDNIVLGGNMRLKALTELGYKEIPATWVRKASELTEEEQRRFIIADNVGFGDWDYDMLKLDFEANELDDWGLYIPESTGEDIDLDEFFEEKEEDHEEEQKSKIILEFTEDDYLRIQEALKADGRTAEQVLWDTLIEE